MTQDAEDLLKDCKTILERMASDRSLDTLNEAIKDFANHLKENQEIRNYFSQLKAFMLKAVESPEYFMKENNKKELQMLMDDGRRLFEKNRENPSWKTITKEMQEFRKAFVNDPITKKLKNNLQKVAEDFWLDEQGNPFPNVDAISQFRKVILPILGDQFNNVPLPSIEQGDENMAYGVEGVVLRGKKLVPDRIDIKIDASVHLIKDVPATTNIMLNIRDIGIQVDQARFWYERYSFPKVSDSGNINLTIEGMNVKLEITNTPNDVRRVFKLNNEAECTIDSVTYGVSDAKHETAYKLLQPILTSVLKAQIKHAVEDNLTSFLQMLDRELIKRRHVLNQLSKETSKVVDKAKEGAKELKKEAGEMMDKAKEGAKEVKKEAGEMMDKAKEGAKEMKKEASKESESMDVERKHHPTAFDSGVDSTPITGYGKTTATTSAPKTFDAGATTGTKQKHQ
jgi:hypothetical protein